MSEIQRWDTPLGWMKESPDDGDYVLYTDHLAVVAEREREKDELLANQRRRMGAEYDDLDAELKRVRIVAAEQIAALQAELDAWQSVFGTSQLSHAQARLEQAEKDVAALTARIKELEGALEKIYNLCFGYGDAAGIAAKIAKAALEVKP